MDLISDLKQRLNRLNQLNQNLEEFATNRGVESVDCLFDFIPDEILFTVFEYNVGLNVTLINKRFNAVYLSWALYKVNNMLIAKKIPGWDDYIVESGIISRQCLYTWMIFNSNAQSLITYDAEKDHHIVELNKDGVKYKFNFVDGVMYTGQMNPAIKNDYGSLEIREASTNNQKYLNIRYINSEDIVRASVNVIKGSCYAIYVKDTIILSDGENHIIIEKDGDHMTHLELNGLYYSFPKRGHPNYKEIMKILMSDNSPYPIEIMNHIPM